MSSTIKIKAPAMPEPPLHCIKNIEVNQMTRIGAYKNAATARGALKARGKSPDRFDAVPVYTADQLAARDAQWQEMVGPILKELKDAATSLETIGRLAGFAEYGGDDGERVPTYMKHGDEIRGYAKSRASAARAALSAITEE